MIVADKSCRLNSSILFYKQKSFLVCEKGPNLTFILQTEVCGWPFPNLRVQPCLRPQDLVLVAMVFLTPVIFMHFLENLQWFSSLSKHY